MNLKDKIFNGLILGGTCVVCAIVAAFLFQDILGYDINLFKNRTVVEEETTITLVEVETESKDYSFLPTAEEILAEREARLEKQEEQRLALAESQKLVEEETATLPAVRVEETQPSKIVVKEEAPTVITNGEASSFISNPVVGKDGNVTNNNNNLEPETTIKNVEVKENPTTGNSNDTAPNTTTGMTLDEWNKMIEGLESGGANTSEELIFELSGEHTGY